MQQWPSARLVAIVADTHGLVRECVLDAPVVAIRGNVDADSLPATEVVSVNDRLVYLLHNLADLDLNPLVAGFSMVVSGHSHQPLIRTKDEVLYVNPGSIGPRRFKLPISFAMADFGSQPINVRFKEFAE
jgi:predicted phosphodiesterase